LETETLYYLESAGVPSKDDQSSFFTVAGNTNPTLLYHDDTRVNWKDKLLAQSLKMAKPQAIPCIKIFEERQDRTFTQQMREKRRGK